MAGHCAKHEAAAFKPLFEKHVDASDVIRIGGRDGWFAVATCPEISAGEHTRHTAQGHPEAQRRGERQLSGALRLFLYCCTWALGGLLEMKDRPPLNKAMVRLAESEAPNFEDPEDTFFEYFVSDEDTEWRHWNTQVPAWEYPAAQEKPKFARLIIPTLDSVRLESLLKIVTSVDKQALFVGGPGTAKTTAIKQFMAGFDSDTTATKDITFSSLTQPGTFQVAIESSVEKRQGRTFGPPSGKRMIVFVDDLSMPVMNEWGDQITNEVARQLLEQGGMYSLEKPIGEYEDDCGLRVPRGDEHARRGAKTTFPIASRGTSASSTCLPSVAAINNIFGQLVAGRFQRGCLLTAGCGRRVQAGARHRRPVEQGRAKMLPTPAKFHYLFNMRELSKVFQGLIRGRDRFRENNRFVQPFGGKVKSPRCTWWRCGGSSARRVFATSSPRIEDKDWGDKLIMKLIDETYGEDIRAQVEDRVFFVDFFDRRRLTRRLARLSTPTLLHESTESLDSLRAVAMARQASFNETSKSLKLDLVLLKMR